MMVHDDLSPFDRLQQAFAAAIALQPCLIVIDGIDHLTASAYCNTNQVLAT